MLMGRLLSDTAKTGAFSQSKAQSFDYSIGEIHLHEVQNVDEFANALKQTWVLQMQQNRSKKF